MYTCQHLCDLTLVNRLNHCDIYDKIVTECTIRKQFDILLTSVIHIIKCYTIMSINH